MGGSLGWVAVGLCGWLQLWSGCCEGLGLGLACRVQWVVWFAGVGGFGFWLGLGFGVARVLLVGQTVPEGGKGNLLLPRARASENQTQTKPT